MILLSTELKLHGDLKYVQFSLNIMLGKTHPDYVNMSHNTHKQLL